MFSGKLFLIIGVIFLGFTIVMVILPNDAETDPESQSDVLRTHVYHTDPQSVLALSDSVIRSLEGWSIIAVNSESGEIAAQCTTSVASLVDEVEITIRAGGNEKESEVDVSSASRLGLYDFGRNERNIEEFFTSLDRRLQRVR